MFAIRVNWGAQGPAAPAYSVYACEKYVVSAGGNDTTVLTLGDDERQISLAKGDVAYAMNQRGATIDTIRP